MEPYDYFSDVNQSLIMADYQMNDKKYANSDYQIGDRPVQTIARDRLVQRQTYSQTQRLDNPNKPITMNNGVTDQIVIGFSEDAFA